MCKHGGTPSWRDKYVTLAAISPPGVARGRFVGGQSGLAGCKLPPLFKRGASSCSSQRQRQREPWDTSPRPSAPTYLPTYHSLTKQVQDDWFKLMRVLGQRFDSMSHEPVYMSRMLTLRESEFPQLADYAKEFRTCVIKSKVNTSDLQMGYLLTSRFVEGSSNDAVR